MIHLNAGEIKTIDDIGDNVHVGRYHASVYDVKVETEAVIVDFLILKGTINGQEGKKKKEYFNLSEKSLPKLMRFAMAVDLIHPGEVRAVDFNEARHRHLIIEIEMNTWKGRTRPQVSYAGMWPLNHPDVKEVPLDRAALEAGGIRLGPGGAPVAAPAGQGGPTQGAAPATAQAAPAQVYTAPAAAPPAGAPVAAGAPDWGNL